MADRYASLKQGLVGCWIPSVSGSGLLLPDLSGRGNNGAISTTGANFVSTTRGVGLQMDQRVTEFNPVSINGTDDFTISIWTNLSTTQIANDQLIPVFGQKAAAAAASGWMIYYWYGGANAGKWMHSTANGTNASEVLISGTANTQGSLAHIVMRRSAAITNNGDFYINGIQYSLASSSTLRDVTTTSKLRFSSDASGLRATNQTVLDARVYSRLLTEPEIRLLASEPGIGFKRNSSAFATRYAYKPAKPRNYSVIRNRDPNYSTLRQGLVAAYCPSISGQGNVLPDLVGGNHGTLTNMTADDWVSSGDGRALDFDGTDDYINVADTNTLSPTSAMSISFWAKPTALPAASNGNRMWAVTKGDTSNFEYECSINSFSTSFGKWNCSYYNLAADGVRARASVVDAIAGQWQHVCWTAGRDGDFPNIYFNGELSNGATISFLTPTPSNGTAPLQIGRRANGSDVTFNGQLDDIRLYSRALSEPEIKLLASKRGIGLEPRKPKITFTDLGVQKTYSVVRVKETDYATLRQGLVGAWCPSLANGGSGNTLPDQSGRGNHGTLTNMSAGAWVSSGSGRALDFDGVNDFLDYGRCDQLSGLGVLSCSFWCYPKSANEMYGLIRYNTTTALGSERRADYFGIQATGSILYPVCYFSLAGNPTFFQSFTSTSLPVAQNNWSHIAFSVNLAGNTATIAVNGVSVAGTRSSGGTPPTATAAQGTVTWRSQTYIGSGGTQFYFDGQIDDLRAYSRALTESEIKLLASRPGIGLRQESHRNTFYQFPSGSRRRRILTGMP